MLVVMYSAINNCYWLTLYNVTSLGGDKFVNGLILGLSEMSSGIFAGLLITYTSPAFAFQTLSVIGILFNALNQFFVEPGTFMGYATLFIAILGVGGVYTCLFVLIGLVIPKQKIGGAMVLIITIGVGSSLGAPMIVLYDAPIPFFVLTVLILVSFIISCFLPKLGPDEALEAEEKLYVEV